MMDGQEQDNLAIIRQAFALKRDHVRANEGLLTGEQIEDVLELLSVDVDGTPVDSIFHVRLLPIQS